MSVQPEFLLGKRFSKVNVACQFYIGYLKQINYFSLLSLVLLPNIHFS